MAPTHLLQLERACKKVAKMDGNDFSSSLFNLAAAGEKVHSIPLKSHGKRFYKVGKLVMLL